MAIRILTKTKKSSPNRGLGTPKKTFGGARRYAILPIRAVVDTELSIAALRVLGCLCCYTNAHGVAWPSRETMARQLSYSIPSVARGIKLLTQRGYIRRLKIQPYRDYKGAAVARRARCSTARRQILFDGQATPLPSREEFWAPRPRLVDESSSLELNSDGVLGVETHLAARAIAASHSRGVASCSGLVTPARAQDLALASRLAAAGWVAEQIGDLAAQVTADRMAEGRAPPGSIAQTLQLAGIKP